MSLSADLKEYQRVFIDDIVNHIKQYLNEGSINRRYTIVGKSPTGSGKTISAGHIIYTINRVIKNVSWLWISPGSSGLHKQSYESLHRIYGTNLNLSLIDDMIGRKQQMINAREIVVTDWEMINRDGNKIMQGGDGPSLEEMMENTRKYNKVIAIIDESQHTLDTNKSIMIMENYIKPNIIFELSATPSMKEYDHRALVEIEDVIKEGMIKRELIVNDGLKNIADLDDKDSQCITLEAAIQKRNVLMKEYKACGVNVNPLVLIQIPDSAEGKDKRQFVEDFLHQKTGACVNNGRVAVDLDEDKCNIENISNHTHPAEFMIFKKVIALGWDCPRAEILVVFRESKSITFKVQTVGRILRTINAKHYDNNIIDAGYVFTNISGSLEIDKDIYSPKRVKRPMSWRKSEYDMPKLISYYKGRTEQNDVGPNFYTTYSNTMCSRLGSPEDSACTMEGWSVKIDSTSVYKEDIYTDLVLDSAELDKQIEKDLLSDNKLPLRLSDNDLLHHFQSVIKAQTRSVGFAPVRSLNSIKEAIYKWFINRHLVKDISGDGIKNIQTIFLCHAFPLLEILREALVNHKPIREAEEDKKPTHGPLEWEVPKEELSNDEDVVEVKDMNKSIMQPYLVIDTPKKPKSKVEYALEKGMNKSNSVKWWYKNGDNGKKYFSVPYEDENGHLHSFYVDYVIMATSGNIWLIDAKGGQTAKCKEKAEALQLYTKKHSSDRLKLHGGIVIISSRMALINSSDTYIYDESNLSADWQQLKIY